MGVIVVVCAAFGLTVSDEGGAGVHRHIQRRGSGPGVKPNKNKSYTSGGTSTTKADLSIVFNRRIRNAWYVFQKYTLELYDRLSDPLELHTRMLRVEVLETILYGCAT